MAGERDRSEKRRYRKVQVRVWDDEKFRGLSKPKANAQTLWLYLLTAPQTSAVPGLIVVGEAQLAEVLGWPLSAFRRCWKEIELQKMAVADWMTRVVWLPNAVEQNQPENPNVVNAWRVAMHEIPECALKAEADIAISDYLDSRGPEWLDAWQAAMGDTGKLRRALRRDAELRSAIKDRDGDLCRYCGLEVSWTDRRGARSGTYDHVDPDGSNAVENIVTACRSCNARKRHRTPQQAGMALVAPRTDLGLRPEVNRVPFHEATQVPLANQEQEQEQERSPQPPKGGSGTVITTEALAMKAASFLGVFSEIYARVRGAASPVREARDQPKAIEIVAKWPDLARLSLMVEVFLKLEKEKMNHPGSIGQFAYMAPECDHLLAVNGR